MQGLYKAFPAAPKEIVNYIFASTISLNITRHPDHRLRIKICISKPPTTLSRDWSSTRILPVIVQAEGYC